LEQVLAEAPPSIRVDADDRLFRAIERCQLHRPQRSFLYTGARKLRDWLS